MYKLTLLLLLPTLAIVLLDVLTNALAVALVPSPFIVTLGDISNTLSDVLGLVLHALSNVITFELPL